MPGWEDDPEVPVRVYRPAAVAPGARAPGIVMIHGGGFVIGSVEAEHAGAALVAIDTGAVVVSVEYRLAPEHPYPAGLHDCYAALTFVHAEADALGVDPGRVALLGASAGGGLAAATALLARDLGGPPVCFQMLHIPELDDRLDTPSMRAFVESPVWNRPLAGAELAGVPGRPVGNGRRAPLGGTGPDDRPLGPAPGLHLDGRERSAARRGDHLCPPAAPGRGLGGAALVPGDLPRLGDGHDGRRLPAGPARGGTGAAPARSGWTRADRGRRGTFRPSRARPRASAPPPRATGAVRRTAGRAVPIP